MKKPYKYNIKIDELINDEIININRNHDPFHSPHEGWAIIREEVIETDVEIDNIYELLSSLDKLVREDKPLQDHRKCAEKIKEKAIRCIEEAIQIAATANRYITACSIKNNEFRKLK